MKLFYSLSDVTSIMTGPVVCLEIPVSKNLYYTEASLLISNANQPSVFYMIFTESYKRTDYSYIGEVFLTFCTENCTESFKNHCPVSKKQEVVIDWAT